MTMMTTSPDEIEIELADHHAETIEQIDTPENPVVATEPISLPAALCDDKLLEEINSIPDKMGFKIGDVAEMLNIKQYVLRYWETE
ncbi:MAG: MerR family transcriptional regulator, partial [Proteobacteria bacterium]